MAKPHELYHAWHFWVESKIHTDQGAFFTWDLEKSENWGSYVQFRILVWTFHILNFPVANFTSILIGQM